MLLLSEDIYYAGQTMCKNYTVKIINWGRNSKEDLIKVYVYSVHG